MVDRFTRLQSIRYAFDAFFFSESFYDRLYGIHLFPFVRVSVFPAQFVIVRRPLQLMALRNMHCSIHRSSRCKSFNEMRRFRALFASY